MNRDENSLRDTVEVLVREQFSRFRNKLEGDIGKMATCQSCHLNDGCCNRQGCCEKGGSFEDERVNVFREYIERYRDEVIGYMRKKGITLNLE